MWYLLFLIPMVYSSYLCQHESTFYTTKIDPLFPTWNKVSNKNHCIPSCQPCVRYGKFNQYQIGYSASCLLTYEQQLLLKVSNQSTNPLLTKYQLGLISNIIDKSGPGLYYSQENHPFIHNHYLCITRYKSHQYKTSSSNLVSKSSSSNLASKSSSLNLASKSSSINLASKTLSSNLASKTLSSNLATKSSSINLASKTLNSNHLASKTLSSNLASKTLSSNLASKTLSSNLASKTLSSNLASKSSSSSSARLPSAVETPIQIQTNQLPLIPNLIIDSTLQTKQDISTTPDTINRMQIYETILFYFCIGFIFIILILVSLILYKTNQPQKRRFSYVISDKKRNEI